MTGKEILNLPKEQSQKYILNKFTNEMIFDFEELVNQQQWNVCVDKKKVSWLNMKEMYNDPKNRDIVKIKYDFDNPNHHEINLQKKNQSLNLKNYELKLAYSGDLGISAAKLKDLLFLCEKNAIPPSCHSYYKLLKIIST